MANTHTSQNGKPRRNSNTNAEQPLRSVRQDKNAPKRERIATIQPVTPKNMTRTHQMNTKISRSQKRSMKRKTVYGMIWMSPALKADIQGIAAQEGLSFSQTGKVLLEEAVRQRLHIRHAVLLQPIIETTIRQELRGMMKKLVLFLSRNAYEAGWTRRLASNILKYQPGIMTEEKLNTILDRSSVDARKYMFRKTPETNELNQAIEKWLLEGEGNK